MHLVWLASRLSSAQGRVTAAAVQDQSLGEAHETLVGLTYWSAGRDVEELGESLSAARQEFGKDHDHDRDAWSWRRRS
jgi:hypothetical protein